MLVISSFIAILVLFGVIPVMHTKDGNVPSSILVIYLMISITLIIIMVTI